MKSGLGRTLYPVKEFINHLATEVPKFDEEIMKDFYPESNWIGSFQTGVIAPTWFSVREEVRRLSEGLAYVPDRFEGLTPSFHWPNNNEPS